MRKSLEDSLNAAANRAAAEAMENQRSRIIGRTRVGLDADYKPMDPLIDPKPSGSRPLVAGMEFFDQTRVSAAEDGAGAALVAEGLDATIIRGQERWGRKMFSMTDRDREEIVSDFKERLMNELRGH